MGSTAPLAKAKLIELDAAFVEPAAGGSEVEVQFNPESLKVTYQNKPKEQRGAGDQRGNSTRQIVGSGESKLAFQLWFDLGSPGSDGATDVRALSSKVTFFMTPRAATGRGAATTPTPPGVRFQWGTFRFDGLMEGLDETLDVFSPDGRPLRSTMAVSLSGQLAITSPTGTDAGGLAALGPTAGTRPLDSPPAGASLPWLAAAAGLGSDWQAVAAANGIENPRLLAPGVRIDLGGAA